MIQWYSMLRPSCADSRDYRYQGQRLELREQVDLREWDSAVEDQSTLGSCVGSAIAAAYEHITRRQASDQFVELSKLFIYYNARVLEDAVSLDQGATLRNGLQGCKVYGICREDLWPYKLEQFDDRPPDTAYEDAKHRLIKEYRSLSGLSEILDALDAERPVVIGVTLYEPFLYLDAEHSTVPMPQEGDITAGDHAMVLVGYDQSKKLLLAKNSFGKDWGDQGYCWIPYDYAEKYIFEQWVFDIEFL